MVLYWLVSSLQASAPPAADIQSIMAQQGCYKVTFHYQETETLVDGIELQKPKRSEIIEWIAVTEQSDRHVALQHILVTPPRIKHWEQIWTYEKQRYDVHSGANQWTQKELSADRAAEAWVQEVRGVADNPRYACSAKWDHSDGSSWTCQTWAPKPRRDKKQHYNVLLRTNTHRILDAGWVHEQQNTKLVIEQETVTPIINEYGNNTYERIDDAECAEAAEWWTKRQATWDQIQSAWIDVRAQHQTYSVDTMGGAFPLWIRLFWLARKPLPAKKHARLYNATRKLLSKKVRASTLQSAEYDSPSFVQELTAKAKQESQEAENRVSETNSTPMLNQDTSPEQTLSTHQSKSEP